MPADSYPSGVPAPRLDRLVTTSEASVLLGVDEGAIWRLLDEVGIDVHALREGGEKRLSISVRDLLYLRAHPRLADVGLRLVLPAIEVDSEETSREDRLRFELELVSGEYASAKARIAQLEEHQHQHLGELERAETELEEERGQRLQREIFKSHLARVSERLAASQGRLVDLEGALDEATRGRDQELEARDGERASLRAEHKRLEGDLACTRTELEELRRALLVGQAERGKLRRDLSLSQEIERATQSYCDRLERQLGRGR